MIGEEIVLIQEVSSDEVELGGIICFKNKIINNTSKIIKNIIFENVSTVVLDKVYYEFKKNNNDISIEKNGGIIEIDYLNPNDEVEIYITAIIAKGCDTENFIAFSKIKYNILSGNLNLLESNQNIINIIKENESEKTISILADKKYIEFGEIVLLDINIINKKNKVLQCSQIEDLIPLGTELVKNSLKINNNDITIDDCINKIKLGDLKALQKINIKLKVKFNNEEINCIEHKIKLSYTEILDNQINNVLLESNTLKINILKAEIELIEEYATKTTYMKNEKIIFKINIKNVGTVALGDLKIFCNFKENLIIDNIIENRNLIKVIEEGLFINKLEVGEEIKIIYQGHIAKLGFYKQEDIKVTFSYLNISKVKKYKMKIVESNTAINIEGVNLILQECTIAKTNLFLGEITKFKIILLNKGNVCVDNVRLHLNLQKGLIIENGYIKVDGSKQMIINSNLYIGCIEPNMIKTLICDVKAVDILKIDFSKNMSMVKYEYMIGNELHEDFFNIAIDNIFISGAQIKADIINDNEDYNWGLDGILNEHIKILNSGNIVAKNILIQQEENKFIEINRDSIKIDGKKTVLDDNNAILLGNLEPNKFIDLKYVINKKNLINNANEASYKLNIRYESVINDIEQRIINDLGVERSGIKIQEPIVIYSNRTINKKIAQIGDEIIVNIKLENIGNDKAYDVKLIEELPIDVEFYDLELNGVKLEVKNNNIDIGIMDVNETVSIKYKFILLDSFKKYTEVESSIFFRGIKNLKGDFFEKITKGDILKLERYIVDIDINIEKVETKIFNGEEVYSILLRNMGETSIEDIDLKVNVNTQMKYIILEKDKKFDDRFILKQNEEITLLYKINFEANRNFKEVQLEAVLDGKAVYKEINVEFSRRKQSDIYIININKINVNKEVFEEYYLRGEEAEFLIKVENKGNSIAKNIVLEDSIFDFDIVENSFNINGEDINYSIINSIMIEQINPFEYSFIRFLVNTKNIEGNCIKSIGRIECKFCNDRRLEEYIQYFEPFELNLKNIDINIMNNLSKQKLGYREELKMNTLIRNVGEIKIYNIEVIDCISTDLEVIKYSLYIDGKKMNNFLENKKIKIPELQKNEICEIKREVSYKGRSSNDNIEVLVLIRGTYKDQKNREKRIEIVSEKEILEGILCVGKKVKIESNINIIADSLKDINNINIKPKILSSYIIESLISRMDEEEKFTGKKLIIRGCIEIELEYIAANLVENIYFQKEIRRFATYINIPEEFNEENFDIRIDINNIEYEKISDKLIWNEVILQFNVMI